VASAEATPTLLIKLFGSDPTSLDRIEEYAPVALCLVGIGHGELRNGFPELFSIPQIA
jgi:hypothetical protein